jgi:hypothetical protein
MERPWGFDYYTIEVSETWVYVRDAPQLADPPRPVPCREGYLLI